MIAVRLDGVRIGSAPSVLLGLPEGTHELTLSADGFLPYSQSVTLEADREVVVSGSLLGRRGCDRAQRAGCAVDCSEGDASACLRVLELDASRFDDEYEPEHALAALTTLRREHGPSLPLAYGATIAGANSSHHEDLELLGCPSQPLARELANQPPDCGGLIVFCWGCAILLLAVDR